MAGGGCALICMENLEQVVQLLEAPNTAAQTKQLILDNLSASREVTIHRQACNV